MGFLGVFLRRRVVLNLKCVLFVYVNIDVDINIKIIEIGDIFFDNFS